MMRETARRPDPLAAHRMVRATSRGRPGKGTCMGGSASGRKGEAGRRGSNGRSRDIAHGSESDPDEGREWGRPPRSDGDPGPLTADWEGEIAAQEAADEKVALVRSALRAALITLPLLVFLPPVGVLAFLYFGIRLGRPLIDLLYAPRLRDRFVHDEVHRRVHRDVSHERQSLEVEHQRSLEQLSASIAHEIRNPITAAKSLIQQMTEDPAGEDRAEYARVAVAELERVERSISHLLRFAREEEMRSTRVAMRDVLESALETFRDRAAREGVEIERQFDSEGSLEGDPEQLRRVVINLVSNALDAVRESRVARPRIRIGMGENLAGTEVWLRVADDGLGIDDETRARIFDPFFTSRSEGTGLGLALCRKIVDQHGGTIEVDSTPGEGTEFVLTFPKERPR